MTTRRLTGSRIREKRLDLGLRQAAVAEAVGISPSYLNLIEHNKRRIGGKLLADLARVMGTDTGQFTQGVPTEMVDQLRAAAAELGTTAEIARAEELAARFPGWADVIVAQSRRMAALDAQVRSLSDRMTYDPQLASALHDVISSVTAIRSSASILVGPEELDADWQRRFHENIHKDSLRLAETGEALVARLEAPEDGQSAKATALDMVSTYLAHTGFHVAALEGPDPSVDAYVDAANLGSPAAAKMLRMLALRYVEDAQTLPLDSFAKACAELDYDPAALCARFSVDFAVVLRRLACLPGGAGHPPFGLAVIDGSGAFSLLKPVPGFRLPTTGGACPLWPIYGALSRPSQPVRAEVELPGALPARFLCYAVANPIRTIDFDGAPVLHSTMLVMPDPPQSIQPVRPVGVSCQVCPRPSCPARREPSVDETL